ncbi:hypothetical protein AJ80_07068 [Polytolypa hystricis UAMH7299]|uniref:BZIP domain-containing protein n=1 Tax=Polytolypa hystricis (strain UAMH7299) TaxID=1447883 RepID=A0A2B7XSM3_POLH7|nr:hypothetical protein AJ80_07068 [Polytolypa hystricis UAMH7299]
MVSTLDRKRPPSTRPTQTTKNNAAHQQNKKRAQNRTSQQCLRERQQAHTRHLESLVELMMASQPDGEGPEKQNQALMASNLKLIEQNRQLQDALFRMKKKFLGLSNMAAAAANDEIFDQLLGTDSNNKVNRLSRSSSAGEAEAGDRVHSGKESHGSVAESINTKAKATVPSLSGDFMTVPGELGQPLQLCEGLAPSQGAMTVPTYVATPPSGPLLALPSVPQMTGTFKPVPMLMIERIMKVCSVYLRQSSETGSMNPPEWSEKGRLSEEAPKVTLVERLREAVVHTMASWAGLESYLYGIGVFAPMERIVQWRLTRSLEDRLAIPEPFRPTPLQLDSEYPISIDFLNWASIRDQLILHRDRYDLMLLTREIVMNTVIDLPPWSASVNIHDIFYNKILPSNLIPEGLFSPHKDAGQENSLSENLAATDPELAEQLIRRDLNQRLTHGLYLLNEEDTWQLFLYGVPPQTRPRFARPPLNKLAGCYGVDQVTQWKLSPAFARKYPFLDCIDVTATFEMLPCSDLPGL